MQCQSANCSCESGRLWQNGPADAAATRDAGNDDPQPCPPQRRPSRANGCRTSGKAAISSPGCACSSAITCAVSPAHWYVAFIVTFVSLGHTLLRWVQEAWYGSRLDRVPIPHAPLFIIGHWRTGTTLLHEMLILDPRHTYPNTYQCLEPNHFLLTETLFTRWFRFLLPSRRPMDNMPAGWERPQEDEFALCMMGQPSPYLTIAFPNHPPQDPEALDLDGLPPRSGRPGKTRFCASCGISRSKIRAASCSSRRRIPAASRPCWNCFPTLASSTSSAIPMSSSPRRSICGRRCTSRTACNGRRSPDWRNTSSTPSRTCMLVWNRASTLLAAHRFHELRYEDLIADPIGQMRLLYERLELGGFEEFVAAIEGVSGRQRRLQNEPLSGPGSGAARRSNAAGVTSSANTATIQKANSNGASGNNSG